MDVEYKSLRIKLSSWRKLRRAFYGRKDETFSDYIERLSELVRNNLFIPKVLEELKNEK